jgi:autotransporter-associated beta strand protein
MAAIPMKTQHLKGITQIPNKLPGILVAFFTVLLFFEVLPEVLGQDLFWTGNINTPPAAAGSGTWLTPEPSGFFSWSSTSASNTPTNWVDGSVAHFLGSNGGTATLGSDITAAGINFDAGANAFTIETNLNTLTITGNGIANSSGKTQTIINNAGVLSSTGAGVVSFNNASTAGSATIINNGSTASNASGGETDFNGTSTAGSATIINNGGANVINNGAAFSGDVGLTQFLDTSTAGNATITNNGGTAGGEVGGITFFQGSSTAGSATIVNNGGTISGSTIGASLTIFTGASTAGSAKITNNGGTVGGATGGETLFIGNTGVGTVSTVSGGTAPTGTVSTPIGSGGVASAGNATITNNGGTTLGAVGGITSFSTSSTAGNATIITNGGTGGGFGGITEFGDNADGGTAHAITNGNGTFDISGLTTPGMGIGSIEGSGNYFLGSKTLTVGGNNSSTTVSGVIQDGGAGSGLGGSLIKVGTGTLTLSGTNLYTGGTTIIAGTLQIGNGGTTGSIIGNVADNSILAFNRSDSLTFGGVISGTGNLVKIGAGTLTLPGANTYTGSTTVNAGSLIVDGSIASAQTLVNSGGSLGGHGFIGGGVVNNGIVRQVNSPGTLTIKGNYTQNASGTLSISVAGAAQGQHDLLAVQGHASLAGTLQLVRLGGFNLQPGDQITFLTANSGVSGTFGTLHNDFSTGTLVNGEVVYLPTSVVLEATQGSFSQIVASSSLTPNQAAVAKGLDSAVGDPRAAALFAFINTQPVSSLPQVLNLISPEQISSFQATGAAHGNVQIANLGGRMANIHAGSTGFSSTGLTLTGNAASLGEGFAGVSGSEGKGGPSVFAPIPENRWGVFATGIGEFTNVDSTPNAAGYNLDTGGMTLGVDYRLFPFLAIGLTAGYAHTNVDIDAGGGNIDVNSGKFGLYATAFGRGFYLDTAVSGGPSGYTTHRKALEGTATGSTGGADFNALVAVGYDWKIGGLSIGPTANFQYGYTGLDSFTETGSLAPLKYPNQSNESERTQFGLKTSYDWKIGHIDLLPEFSAAWQHEYGDSTYSIVASLASGAGNSFTVNGPPIGRDSLLIGAGLAVILNERVTTYLYYDGQFLRTNYLNNNVSAGIRVTF